MTPNIPHREPVVSTQTHRGTTIEGLTPMPHLLNRPSNKSTGNGIFDPFTAPISRGFRNGKRSGFCVGVCLFLFCFFFGHLRRELDQKLENSDCNASSLDLTLKLIRSRTQKFFYTRQHKITEWCGISMHTEHGRRVAPLPDIVRPLQV